MRRSRGVLTAVIMMTAVSVVGCGDDDTADDARAGPSSTTTAAVATPTTLSFRTEVGASAPADAVVVSMRDLKFVPSELEARAGTVTFALSNDEDDGGVACLEVHACDHQFQIFDPASPLPVATSDRLAPGAAALFVVEGLQPGTYRFSCPVRGHATVVGMKGTLEVVA